MHGEGVWQLRVPCLLHAPSGRELGCTTGTARPGTPSGGGLLRSVLSGAAAEKAAKAWLPGS